MIVMMEHPLHGRTHVYSVADMLFHARAGWYEVKPDIVKPDKKPVTDAQKRAQRAYRERLKAKAKVNTDGDHQG